MTDTPTNQLTAAVVTYNSERYLRDCLLSLRAAGLHDEQILVTDDGSVDGTAAIMATEFPDIRFLAADGNRGHSHACNRALHEATTAWVVLIDHDTEVAPEWLAELQRAMAQHPDAAVIVSRTVFAQDRRTIHADGGFAHFLGNMTLRNGFKPLADADDESMELGAAGSTSMAVNRDWALRVGGFDEAFFIYLNDLEFSLRLRLAGGRLYCAPRSIIYHKGGTPDISFRGQKAYPARRAYLILRNRWFLMLKLYRIRTLLLTLPALLFYEVLLLLMAFRKGVWREYGRAWEWLIRHQGLIREQRRQAQSLRRIGDAQLLSAGPLSFVPGVVKGRTAQWCKAVLDRTFNWYWRLIVRFL